MPGDCCSVDRSTGSYARKYYSFLFALPRARTVYAIMLFLLFLEIVASLQKGPRIPILLATYSIVLMICCVKGSTPLGMGRRRAAIASIGYSVAILPSILLSIGLIGEDRAFTSVYLALFSTTLIVYGLSGIRAYLFTSTILSSTFLLLSGNTIVAIASFFSATLIALAYEYLLSDKIEAARAFIEAILDDNYSRLERLIGKHAEEKELLIRLTTYTTENGDCTSLVLPRIHYGPFRDSFSSTLPYRLEEAVSKHSVNLLVLHGDVDHHYNLASKREEERAVKIVSDEIVKNCAELREGGEENVTIYSFLSETCGEFRCILVPSLLPLIVLERPGKGIDDIVLYPDKYPFVVDAHNEEEVEKITPEALRTLSREIKAFVGKVERVPLSNCSLAFEELFLEDNVAKKLGICKPWIKLVLYKCSGRELLVVVVPSNNAEPGARREFLQRIEHAATVDEAVLITIDDHTCSGVVPGAPSFALKDGSFLAEKVLERYASLRNSLSRVKTVAESFVALESIVWGDALEYLKFIGKKGYRYSYLFLAVFGGFVVASILAMFYS